MLNWICPDCGRECLPATRECPACAAGWAEARLAEAHLAEARLAEARRAEARLAEARLSEELLAESRLAQERVAEAIQAQQRRSEEHFKRESNSMAALSAAISGTADEVRSNSGGVATALMEAPVLELPVLEPPAAELPPPAEPEPRPAVEQDLQHVRQSLGERISRVQQVYAQSFLEAQVPSRGLLEPEQERREAVISGLLLSQRKSAEEVLRTEAEEQWDVRMAEAAAAQLTPVIDIWEAAQRVNQEEQWRTRIEEQGRRQRDRRLRELEGAISSTAAEHVHEPVRTVSQSPLPRESAWEREVARQREVTAATVAEDAALAIRVYAREMLDSQAEAAVVVAHEQAIAAVANSFGKPPAFALLVPPKELLMVPARIAGHRNMSLDHFATYPSQPPFRILRCCAFPEATLLPIKVRSQIPPIQPPVVTEPKRVFPSWVLIAVAVVTTILVFSRFFGSGASPAEAKAPVDNAAAATAATDNKPSPAPPSVARPPVSNFGASNTFAKDVEVSGLRIGVDLLHHSQLQYVVTNHSGAQLTGLMLRIRVTSTAANSKGLLFQVSAMIPSLSPNESKEIRTDIQDQLQSKTIPDWQYLKTEVQVNDQ